ncbi:hypothetical protein DPM13_16260 [Paracoccus mutanolyticus]|uniref:Uncharacterized protein n=2 Tax=Paracoccus mutanolyticus TaxID=1499308 RepID=A0ABM6WTI8_9RHOB|nr:hypothetical protein DPM13_16260 [Paracoccus mutanolyticus]
MSWSSIDDPLSPCPCSPASADVFDNHASIQPEWREDLWRLIEATPNLDWMLLTKRPGNIGNMLPVPFDFERLYPIAVPAPA